MGTMFILQKNLLGLFLNGPSQPVTHPRAHSGPEAQVSPAVALQPCHLPPSWPACLHKASLQGALRGARRKPCTAP